VIKGWEGRSENEVGLLVFNKEGVGVDTKRKQMQIILCSVDRAAISV
jgi:hypothetical protein